MPFSSTGSSYYFRIESGEGDREGIHLVVLNLVSESGVLYTVLEITYEDRIVEYTH